MKVWEKYKILNDFAPLSKSRLLKLAFHELFFAMKSWCMMDLILIMVLLIYACKFCNSHWKKVTITRLFFLSSRWLQTRSIVAKHSFPGLILDPSRKSWQFSPSFPYLLIREYFLEYSILRSLSSCVFPFVIHAALNLITLKGLNAAAIFSLFISSFQARQKKYCM